MLCGFVVLVSHEENIRRVTLLVDWLLYYAAREIRTPEGAALVTAPGPEAERNIACDVGAAMFALANVLHAGCLKTIRRVIQGGTTFSVQFHYFVHHRKAFIATCIWIPNQRGCYRGIFRVERLEEMCSRIGRSLNAVAEREMVEAAIEELLVEERLPRERLLSVTCALAPNTFAVYENPIGSSRLVQIVPSELDNTQLDSWTTPRFEAVFAVISDLATLCTTDSYLGRVLSIFGVMFPNLPASQSAMYWPFISEVLQVILREYRSLARLIASGGTDRCLAGRFDGRVRRFYLSCELSIAVFYRETTGGSNVKLGIFDRLCWFSGSAAGFC